VNTSPGLRLISTVSGSAEKFLYAYLIEKERKEKKGNEGKRRRRKVEKRKINRQMRRKEGYLRGEKEKTGK
jgi:hypothetical protein